jgi:hypothetical protein
MKGLNYWLLLGIACLGWVSNARADEYIRCRSDSRRYNECRASRNIKYATVSDRHSDASCNEGSSWGYRGNVIWVDRGCEATFRVQLEQDSSSFVVLRCDSLGDHYQSCQTGLRYISQAYVQSRHSDSRCDQGYSWGVSGNNIWVDRGCRATFVVHGYQY